MAYQGDKRGITEQRQGSTKEGPEKKGKAGEKAEPGRTGGPGQANVSGETRAG